MVEHSLWIQMLGCGSPQPHGTFSVSKCVGVCILNQLSLFPYYIHVISCFCTIITTHQPIPKSYHNNILVYFPYQAHETSTCVEMLVNFTKNVNIKWIFIVPFLRGFLEQNAISQAIKFSKHFVPYKTIVPCLKQSRHLMTCANQYLWWLQYQSTTLRTRRNRPYFCRRHFQCLFVTEN